MSELTHEIAASQPDKYRILSNGAIYDHEVKRIVKAPPKERQYITQENASALATSRWEAYREASELGMMRATRRDTPVEAFGYIVEKQTQLATNIEKGRASTEASRFVSQAIGFTAPEASQGPQTVNIQAFIGNDVVNKAMARRIMEAGGLVDGELASGSGADGAE